MATYTNVPKPTNATYTNVNVAGGREMFDDAGVLFDDPNTFFDGTNNAAWTNVSKPTGSAYTSVSKPT